MEVPGDFSHIKGWEEEAQLNKELARLPKCKQCNGSGYVGQRSGDGAVRPVTCNDCAGTGKEGGDHIKYHTDYS